VPGLSPGASSEDPRRQPDQSNDAYGRDDSALRVVVCLYILLFVLVGCLYILHFVLIVVALVEEPGPEEGVEEDALPYIVPGAVVVRSRWVGYARR
jgi:hypothetical protein